MFMLIWDLTFATLITACLYFVFNDISELYNNHL